MASRAFPIFDGSSTTEMKPGHVTSSSSRERPDFARPRSSAGTITSRRYRAEQMPWVMTPSATSPATSFIRGPTAARNTRGGPNSCDGGANTGVIRVWV